MALYIETAYFNVTYYSILEFNTNNLVYYSNEYIRNI